MRGTGRDAQPGRLQRGAVSPAAKESCQEPLEAGLQGRLRISQMTGQKRSSCMGKGAPTRSVWSGGAWGENL